MSDSEKPTPTWVPTWLPSASSVDYISDLLKLGLMVLIGVVVAHHLKNGRPARATNIAAQGA